MNFLNDLINTLRRGDAYRFFSFFVPRFIVAGLILLALTFLGPIGILIALATIAYVVWRYFMQ